MSKLALAAGALAALAFLLPGRATAATPVQWCGNNTAATDRLPDSTAGRQFHLVYAFPSDAMDRSLEVASVIASDLQDVDTWWRREDPTRTLRFDTFAFPGCTSRMGSLDISSVRLSQPASFYSPEDTRYERLVNELSALPTLGTSTKKYLVYYDGALPADERTCGVSTANPSAGGRFGYSLVYFQAPRGCRDIGAEAFRFAQTAAHELTHNLGALVTPGPPHACPGDAGHPCDSTADLLSPEASSDLFDLHLDVGHDDYYAHPGSWWDVQDSPWLDRLDTADVRLTIAVAGRGSVALDLPGPVTTCTATCETDWDPGTVVTLAPTPAAGAVFTGWSGACTGTSTCRVAVDAAKTATATFVTPTRLTVAVTGPGSVTSTPAGITCPGTCTTDFDAGTRVTLTAEPQDHARFAGWSGACSGTSRTCTVALDQASSVQAAFELIRRTLSVRVTGSGTVTSAPAGIRCKPRCSATYVDGTTVRLVARPARGWRLSGWSGGCRGSRACAVTLNGNARVNAVFKKRR